MKELSIEEKAKAYDNALKVLHKYDGANIMFSQSLKEEMFPELAESEDEKIRKSIIELLNEVHFTFKYYDINKMLAWLEKLPIEKLPFEMKTPEESLGIDSETYSKVVDECIYGEQKSSKKVEPKFRVKYAGNEYNVLHVKDIAGVTYYGIEDEPNHIDYVLPDNCEIISEQKPTWSEEDIQYINDTLALLSFGCSIHSVGEVQEWLQSLSNRVQLKQEWNYNDEIIIGIIIQEIEKIPSEKFIDNAKYRCLEWLRHRTKSLRPQSQWKPSDDQMDALRYVTNFDYGGHKATLVSLYEQLKKL